MTYRDARRRHFISFSAFHIDDAWLSSSSLFSFLDDMVSELAHGE